MSERTHYVYRAYDEFGSVLYVGCTKHPEARFRQHLGGNSYGGRWFNPWVTRWRVSGPYPKLTALRIEKQWIKDLEPIFNGLSAGNRVRDAWGRYHHAKADAYMKQRRAAA